MQPVLLLLKSQEALYAVTSTMMSIPMVMELVLPVLISLKAVLPVQRTEESPDVPSVTKPGNMFCQEPLAALEEANNILTATAAASPVLKQVSAARPVNITPPLPVWIVLSVVQAMTYPFRSAVTAPSEELMM